MPNKELLDMSHFVEQDSETEYQVEIIKPSECNSQLKIPSDRSERVRGFSDDEIKKYERYLNSLLLKDSTRLEIVLGELREEKLFREREKKRKGQENSAAIDVCSSKVNGHQEAKPALKVAVNGDDGRSQSTRASTPNHENVDGIHTKIDGGESESKAHATNGSVLLNPSKGEGPFTQRSPNKESSTLDVGKDTSRTFSGHLAGPSPRRGLRSASRLCGQCGASSTDLSCSTCRFYRKQPKRYSTTTELPERNPGPGKKGNGAKRARQGVGCRDSPAKIAELFSSEDEEVDVTRDKFAQVK